MREEITGAGLTEMKLLKSRLANMYPDFTLEAESAKGIFTSSIPDHAENLQNYTRILGAKGDSGLEEILIGGIAAAKSAGSRMPVLPWRNEHKADAPDNILFATYYIEENRDLLDSMVEVRMLAFWPSIKQYLNILKWRMHSIISTTQDN